MRQTGRTFGRGRQQPNNAVHHRLHALIAQRAAGETGINLAGQRRLTQRRPDRFRLRLFLGQHQFRQRLIHFRRRQQ